MAAGDVVTATVIRPPKPARFGDPGAGAPKTFTIDGCQFAPGPSRELVDGASQVSTDGTLYAPPGSDVLAIDRVVVLGNEYAVVGDPQPWGSAGVVVVLKRIKG